MLKLAFVRDALLGASLLALIGAVSFYLIVLPVLGPRSGAAFSYSPLLVLFVVVAAVFAPSIAVVVIGFRQKRHGFIVSPLALIILVYGAKELSTAYVRSEVLAINSAQPMLPIPPDIHLFAVEAGTGCGRECEGFLRRTDSSLELMGLRRPIRIFPAPATGCPEPKPDAEGGSANYGIPRDTNLCAAAVERTSSKVSKAIMFRRYPFCNSVNKTCSDDKIPDYLLADLYTVSERDEDGSERVLRRFFSFQYRFGDAHFGFPADILPEGYFRTH